MVKGREGKGEGGSRKRRYGRERGGRARLDICQGDPELVTPLPSVIGELGYSLRSALTGIVKAGNGK